MIKHSYRLIFNRVRGVLVAVAEFVSAHGSGAGKQEDVTRRTPAGSIGAPVVSALAWAAIVLLGAASGWANAQVVAAPGSGAQVIQTQNGLNQVNIARPSGSGVSLNTYSQFDVPAKGAILNNSPTNIQTQQAGFISGNANLTPGNSAKIIVNQVMSNAPSQLRGYLEVAGPRSEVIVANPSGLVLDGGGFINTSRAILTTGTPNFGANGSLAGFSVTGGAITVQGAGLNATNVDQVDLLARAIQVNAAIYANNLNVVAGSNQVDHDTLAATPIAGSGAAPSVAIDVSALGGMYANRTQRNGSNITAGGTTSFIAKGNSTAGSGNVTIAGSNVNASDVVLAASNQVNLVNSTDTDSNRSKNESSSGSIGVFYGSSGYGVEASGSRAHGNANSDSTAQNNTHISGTNSVSIVSGGDTNIKGATVNGGQVSALIGGDLNIASVQDTSQSAAHQESQSAGVSISQGGGSASYSQQKGDAHGDYNGVEEQSGNYLDDLTIGSRYTVRGFDGEQMLAAERGFYWRNELQAPVGKTGQTLYAGIDYGRVFGPNTTFLAGTQLVGAVIGIRGGMPSKYVGISYDLFAGTPIYKPSGFPTSRVTVGFQVTAQL